MTNPEWRTRGKEFELAEKAEWQEVEGLRITFERGPILQKGNKGRIDILIEEHDESRSIVEVKATDWDAMTVHRIRPNVLRHARQLMKYVYPFWERGIDVCPGIAYPRAPASPIRGHRLLLNDDNRSRTR